MSVDPEEARSLAQKHISEAIRLCDSVGESLPAAHLQLGHDLLAGSIGRLVGEERLAWNHMNPSDFKLE